MKFPKILEQLQFYLGIPEDIENEIPCFNLSPVEKKEDKSMILYMKIKIKKIYLMQLVRIVGDKLNSYFIYPLYKISYIIK